MESATDRSSPTPPPQKPEGEDAQEKKEPFRDRMRRLLASPLPPPSPYPNRNVYVNIDHIRVLIESGVLFGLFVGGFLGARSRRLQFLAENAHRLPRTQRGWFLYHRERNYQVGKHAGKVGFKFGVRVALLSGTFGVIETAIDVARDDEDWISSVISGTLTGIIFSGAARLPRSSALRFLGYSAIAGLSVGLSQDLYRYLYGESAKYPVLEERTWQKLLETSSQRKEAEEKGLAVAV